MFHAIYDEGREKIPTMVNSYFKLIALVVVRVYHV